MEITGIWVRTDADPEADQRIDPSGQPQILRVMVEIKGEKQWRVVSEHKVLATGQIISHISEAHGWHSKKVAPITGITNEANR